MRAHASAVNCVSTKTNGSGVESVVQTHDSNQQTEPKCAQRNAPHNDIDFRIEPYAIDRVR